MSFNALQACKYAQVGEELNLSGTLRNREFRLAQIVNHRSIFDVFNSCEPKPFWFHINTHEQNEF
jgi:hypothetical protein